MRIWKPLAVLVTYTGAEAAPPETGVIMTCTFAEYGERNVTLISIPALEPEPTFILMVPVVSLPDNDVVPPPPMAEPLLEDGTGPEEVRWPTTKGPEIVIFRTVIADAEIVPKLAIPATARFPVTLRSWPMVAPLCSVEAPVTPKSPPTIRPPIEVSLPEIVSDFNVTGPLAFSLPFKDKSFEIMTLLLNWAVAATVRSSFEVPKFAPMVLSLLSSSGVNVFTSGALVLVPCCFDTCAM